jgi:asparagine synthase (glutamine-hydrolysing)
MNPGPSNPTATMARLFAKFQRGNGASPTSSDAAESTSRSTTSPSGCWEDERVSFFAGPTSARTTRNAFEYGPYVHDRACLLWDGRLDNRAEVASKLGLPKASVPELLVEAYRRWDTDFVDHLVGDWALVIWDCAESRLIAAKDPLGWRPLYFHIGSAELVLASDYRDLWRTGIEPRINDDYLYRYLADATQMPGATPYRGVQHLQGGQMLVASGAYWHVRTFWESPRFRPRNYKSPAEYVAEFDDLVEKVTQAMLADRRPTGIFLSGGLDSSYIAAVAAPLNPAILAISSYAAGTTWDERPYQEMVLEHTGLSGKSVDVSGCTALNPGITPLSAFDIPGTPPQHALLATTAKCAAEEGLEVILSGVGGDEWLTGDSRYVADALLRGHPRRAIRMARMNRELPRATRLLASSTFQAVIPRRVRATMAQVRGEPMWDGLLPFVPPGNDWEGRSGRESSTLLSRARAQRQRWRAYRNDAQGTIEWTEKHCHRANGIEFRSPLNDLRVVEFLAGIPEWPKRFNGRPKDILREALRRRGLLAALYERTDKASYDEPYDRGLCVENREIVADCIDAVCRLRLVDEAEIRTQTTAWLDDPPRHPWEATWRVVSAGRWLQFMDTLSPNEGTSSGAVHTDPGPIDREFNRLTWA